MSTSDNTVQIHHKESVIEKTMLPENVVKLSFVVFYEKKKRHKDKNNINIASQPFGEMADQDVMLTN